MLTTITKPELQAYFEKLFFQENRGNRLDIHWNSQPHIKQEVEGVAAQEEVKQGEPEVSADTEVEAKHIPVYETEKRHQTVNQFKKSFGLFVDNYKLNYATTEFRL